MLIAYDTFLQSEVSATLAAKSGGLEPYRYECAHCGEEVRLAAADSTSMVAHFRHRSGNNDKECENYLGQFGTISVDSRSRKSRGERAEFYFDSLQRMFFLGLCLSENEIAAYESEAAKFEIRTSAQERAVFSLPINSLNFTPDIPSMIPLQRFSHNYFLSNTLNNVKRKYKFFNKDNAPTLFKIQGNDSDYKARLIRSTILYTGVPYLAVYEGYYTYPKISCHSSDMEVGDPFRFDSMERVFIGRVLTIRQKTASIEALFDSWGYQVEASESLALLWPPAEQHDEVSIVKSGHAFLFSSFRLEPHGNINVNAADIQTVGSGVSKVSVGSRVKVYRKNAEIIFDAEEDRSMACDSLSVYKSNAAVYKVPDAGVYFLFNHSGAVQIREGQTVSLTPDSLIQRYHFGYLNGIISPICREELSGEPLLNDLLAHYKRVEDFYEETFDSIDLSDVAIPYVDQCREDGVINSAAKRFIMEGRL